MVVKSLEIVTNSKMATTVEMTTQMFEMLQSMSQSMAKRLDAQDEQLSEMFEIMKKKGSRKRTNPLAPYKNSIRAVDDICFANILSTDQKVFIGMICTKEGETQALKAPLFSMTSNIFSEFMENYNAAEDGEQVALPDADEAKFTRRFAKILIDEWIMPDNLK